MPVIRFWVPDSLKKKMDTHKEINWDVFAENVILETVAKLKAGKKSKK